jgi:hypothetical protein
VELRKQRDIDDILAYAQVLEKNYEALKKQDNIEFLVYNPKKLPKLEKIEKKRKTNILKIRKELLRKVRDIALQLSDLNITIKISSTQEYNLIRNKKRNIYITYAETLHPDLFPWYKITIENLTTYEVYQAYKEIVPSDAQYTELILRKKKNLRLSKSKHNKPILMNNLVVDFSQPYEYCYCKQKKNDQEVGNLKIFILACEYWNDDKSLNKCVSSGWFHHHCVERLKTLSTEEVSSESFKFICDECINIYKPDTDMKVEEI